MEDIKMKNKFTSKIRLFAIALFITALIFNACDNGTGGGGKGGGGSGSGSLTISVGNGGNGRAVLSDGTDSDLLDHIIIINDNSGTPHKREIKSPGGTVSFSSLALGPCTIVVEGYLNGELKSKGSASMNIKEGQNGAVSIKMEIIGDNGKTYTVTFNSNGGSNVSSQTVKDNDKVTRPDNPTKSGYGFMAWYKDAALTNEWNFNTDTVKGDMTLYAEWSTTVYKVTFNSNGGSAVVAQTVGEGGKPSEPTDPTKTGYIFGGWYKDEACAITWDFGNDTVTADMTIYAKWNSYYYTVTFNYNYGSTEPSTVTVASPNTTVSNLPTPDRTGYIFEGWKTPSNADFTASTTVTGDITVNAQWKAITYYVSYNPNANNEQTGTMTNTTHTYGIASNLTANAFLRQHYSFKCWSTQVDGGGETYNNSVSVSSLTTINGVTVPLYAQWNATWYEVTYNANGGNGITPVASSFTVLNIGSGVTISESSNLSKDGYTFNGWNTASNGSGTPYAPGEKYTTLANVTLFAQWQ
jgi:uncharacterized repeat protein (TIGR02543 family)